ncbi:pyridoxamine 5'-phosphate oxidase family protein [Thermoactinospora rubra]|uniref:pyridoxamine 5'-phosphate oxidase family protein n=1 Tax=Thermoactinospora rubra TaxID=1088767 RepID=UPI000A10981F|nr:pyridoxamine 5'-phosphate oxidase family protein [Thermoactinospora rubra]
MSSWAEFEKDAPQLAATVRELMGRHRHKVLATLRKDGSPRVSGTECEIRDGELWLGSMPGAVKALDLRRDPRMALHVTSPDPDERDPSAWAGDAKLAGRAQEVTDPEVLRRFEMPGEGPHLFRVEVEEVVWTRVEGDELVIDSWHPGRGVERIRRK